MTNGRAKGAEAELEVAKILQSWWSSFEPGCVFKRTPLSGGWSHAREFSVAGDITTTAQRFPFCVEVKRNEGWSVPQFFAGKASPVWMWWGQAARQARSVAKEPLLVWRKNRGDWWSMRRAGCRPFFESHHMRRPGRRREFGLWPSEMDVWVSPLDDLVFRLPSLCIAPTLRRG